MSNIKSTEKDEFIFFGCWNESLCNPSKPSLSGSSQVFNSLLKRKTNPLFYIVAGDNYYPRKYKKTKLKIKEFSDRNFLSGLECLEKLKEKVLVNLLLRGAKLFTYLFIQFFWSY